MKKYLRFLGHIAVVSTIIFVFSPFQDTHWPKWMMFYCVSAVGLGAYFGSKIHWSVGCLVAVTIFSGAQSFANRNFNSTQHLVAQLDLSNHAAKATLAFLILLLLAHLMTRKTAESMIKAYLVVCFVHCFYVMYQIWFGGVLNLVATGFLPNISMGPSMLAMLFPFLFWGALSAKNTAPYKIAIPVFVIGCFLNESAIAFAAIIAGTATFFFAVLRRILGARIAWTAAGIIIVIMIPLGVFFDRDWSNVRQISRLQFWPMYWDWWTANAGYLFGTGTGTFRHIGPMIQNINNKDVGQWWLWAHNDWLQVLFETGIAGLLSVIAVLVTAIKRAWRAGREDLVASLVAISVVAAGNYPLRLAEFSFLVMLIVTAAMKSPQPEGTHGRHAP